MTVAELQSRVTELEARVATLEEQLERADIRAAISRGRRDADEGRIVPARELIEQLRAKHQLSKR
jgi:predicted transcriptional regulator